MSSEEVNDVFMWVGGGNYSRESFIKEAKRLGACKRVSSVPIGIVTGTSRVFLISDMSDEDRKKYKEERKNRDKERYRQWIAGGKIRGQKGVTHVAGEMPRGQPQIFAWYTIRGIVYVVRMADDELKNELAERGIEPYEYQAGGFGFEDERECGSLQIGGTYLLSEEGINKIKDLAESGMLEGQIHTISPPIPYTGKHFRGVNLIPHSDGERLLITIPEKPSTAKHSWSPNDDGTSTCSNCGLVVDARLIRKGGLPRCNGGNV